MHTTAIPGDAEEWDFVGKLGLISLVAGDPPHAGTLERRARPEALRGCSCTSHTSGGLAAVWAEENTRDAIFAAHAAP